MTVKELTNLKVQRVDLVDRAAVRDPDNPDQPSRFLVWKSENAPVQKQSAATSRDGVYEEIKKAATATRQPNETDEQAVVRYVTTHPEQYRRYREASEPQAVDKMARASAQWRLGQAIEHVMREQNVNKAEATSRVLKTDQGQDLYRVMIGMAEREQIRLPVSKSDAPYQRLAAIARTIQRSGRAKSFAHAISKAAQENRELYGEYIRALRSETGAQTTST